MISSFPFSANFPPNITGVKYIEAKVGEPISFQVHAVDPNGDEVSLSLFDGVPGASLSAGKLADLWRFVFVLT